MSVYQDYIAARKLQYEHDALTKEWRKEADRLMELVEAQMSVEGTTFVKFDNGVSLSWVNDVRANVKKSADLDVDHAAAGEVLTDHGYGHMAKVRIHSGTLTALVKAMIEEDSDPLSERTIEEILPEWLTDVVTVHEKPLVKVLGARGGGDSS